MNGLSVIIPSKNFDNLWRCLEAVRRCERDANIVVIDDGLKCEQMPEVHPSSAFNFASFLPGEKPFIFSRNVNIGIRYAGNDDIVILGDDGLLESPGGFSLLQSEAEAHPEIGIIGCTTNVTGARCQYRQNVGLRVVEHFAFIAVLIPRRTINKVGLLDERYCIDYGVEDRDYCEAVNRAGLKCAVHDGCYIDHGSLTSTFRGDPRAPKDFSQNLALFNQKWGFAH